MTFYEQYMKDCDFIRGLLKLNEETSLQELVVKFTAEYRRLNEKSQKEKVCQKKLPKSQSKSLPLQK